MANASSTGTGGSHDKKGMSVDVLKSGKNTSISQVSSSNGNKASYDKKSVGGVTLEVESIAKGITPISAKDSVFEQSEISVSSSSDKNLLDKNTSFSDSGKIKVNSKSDLDPVLQQVVDYVLFYDDKKLPDVINPRDVNVNIENDEGTILNDKPVVDTIMKDSVDALNDKPTVDTIMKDSVDVVNGKPVGDTVMKDSVDVGNTSISKGNGLNDSEMGKHVVKDKSVGYDSGIGSLVKRDAVYVSFVAKLKERRKEWNAISRAELELEKDVEAI
ncbi:hypothetical protein L6452_43406 [Arctium lappa]|uniref:Uncharacterized protein n=1 Tax=Arctium lappa TaxID=4217 RepID=A0ACB8XCU9_ARCLA|nr:hypothetical protein L6452_43406 [Arctium lappa]